MEFYCPIEGCVRHAYETSSEFHGHIEVIHHMSRFGLKIVDGRLT
jgi:hypothetical protein